MINKEIRELIADYYGENIILFINPSFDNAIIGISHDNRAIYDYNKMVYEMAQEENISLEEAVEFIDYNTLGSLGGTYDGYIELPIVMYNLDSIM